MNLITQHEAIRRVYPQVMKVHEIEGAFDADGNQIELDQALVDAAAIEIASEQSLAHLRRKRNNLLAETDYLALADATLTDEMRAYRQALRDLPANTADPANPVWPTKP
jgi:uncharacterized protein involved in exopolysaccharide biosynthesis